MPDSSPKEAAPTWSQLDRNALAWYLARKADAEITTAEIESAPHDAWIFAREILRLRAELATLQTIADDADCLDAHDMSCCCPCHFVRSPEVEEAGEDNGAPVGFTAEDVWLLRHEVGGVGFDGYDKVLALADRIEALLPPEP